MCGHGIILLLVWRNALTWSCKQYFNLTHFAQLGNHLPHFNLTRFAQLGNHSPHFNLTRFAQLGNHSPRLRHRCL